MQLKMNEQQVLGGFWKIVGLLLLLSGCAQNTTPQAVFSLNTAKYLNPDSSGRASPLVIDIYQLTRVDAFKKANFKPLNEQAADVLGAALLDRDSVELKPDESRTLHETITKGSRFLGITAGYRNIEQAHWRAIVALPKAYKAINITVRLNSQSISINHVEPVK